MSEEEMDAYERITGILRDLAKEEGPEALSVNKQATKMSK